MQLTIFLDKIIELRNLDTKDLEKELKKMTDVSEIKNTILQVN